MEDNKEEKIQKYPASEEEQHADEPSVRTGKIRISSKYDKTRIIGLWGMLIEYEPIRLNIKRTHR